MKGNIYKILGLSKDATSDEIYRKYKKQALVDHPDKGGDEEKFKNLLRAYEQWKFAPDLAKEDDDFDEPDQPIDGEHIDTNSVPFSELLKAKHKRFVEEYKTKNLVLTDILTLFTPFKSDLYDGKPDIFSYIAEKTLLGQSSKVFKPENEIIPKIAIQVFSDFLTGEYYSNNLILIKRYFEAGIKKLRDTKLYHHETEFYEAIIDIIDMAEINSINTENLLTSIKKITDYAKTGNEAIKFMTPLLRINIFVSCLPIV